MAFLTLGTGKTKTVVSAIEKIIRESKKHVLVCAQSNAACDEIAQRLCKTLNKQQMLRMYSLSYELEKLSPSIKPYCNLFKGEFKYTSLKDLYQYRVLICTLSTAGCLVRARHNIEFRSNHFDYVFIDECASAHETMALIPIAGKIFSNSHTIDDEFNIINLHFRPVYVVKHSSCKYCFNWRPKAIRCSYKI